MSLFKNLVLLASLSSATAFAYDWVGVAKINAIEANDRTDLAILLTLDSSSTTCGEVLYLDPTATKNYKETVALLTAAFFARKPIRFYVYKGGSGCYVVRSQIIYFP